MRQQATHHSAHGINLHAHFIVELAEHGGHGLSVLDGAGKAAIQIAKSSSLRAFRATVTDAGSHIPHPALNTSGNLRGMILSRRSRVIYHLSSNVDTIAQQTKPGGNHGLSCGFSSAD